MLCASHLGHRDLSRLPCSSWARRRWSPKARDPATGGYPADWPRASTFTGLIPIGERGSETMMDGDARTDAEGVETKAGEHGGGDPSSLGKLSREIVRLYKEQFGRGPQRVISSYAG